MSAEPSVDQIISQAKASLRAKYEAVIGCVSPDRFPSPEARRDFQRWKHTTFSFMLYDARVKLAHSIEQVFADEPHWKDALISVELTLGALAGELFPGYTTGTVAYTIEKPLYPIYPGDPEQKAVEDEVAQPGAASKFVPIAITDPVLDGEEEESVIVDTTAAITDEDVIRVVSEKYLAGAEESRRRCFGGGASAEVKKRRWALIRRTYAKQVMTQIIYSIKRVGDKCKSPLTAALQMWQGIAKRWAQMFDGETLEMPEIA